MNTFIEPLEGDQVSNVLRGFFSRRFTYEQLGNEGQWIGSEWKKLKLRSPVQQGDLERLFESVKSLSGYNINGANGPIGWQITFNAHRHESTFWALGSEELKHRAEEVLGAGVKNAMKYLDEKVLSVSGNQSLGNDRGGLYAMFISAAAPGKFPYLNASVLIPRSHVRADGAFSSFTMNLSKMEDELSYRYLEGSTELREKVYGALCWEPKVDPPRMIFPPPLTDGLIRGQIPDTWISSPHRLGGENLLRAWRFQGEARGFGPIEAETMLKRSRRIAKNPFRHEIAAVLFGVNKLRMRLDAITSPTKEKTQSQDRAR